MRGSVLFVDDQVEITSLIQRMLKDEDYVQYYANSGTEALEIMEKHPIDVVVTDMMMPLVSGLQLLSILKERYPETVRIVLSGQLQVASVLAAINSGEIYRYITKPWKVDAESKLIIRNALDYAEYLRKKNRSSQDLNEISVSKEHIGSLIEMTGKPYFLVLNGIIEVLGGSLPEGIIKGRTLEELSQVCNMELFSSLELAPDWLVFVMK